MPYADKDDHVAHAAVYRLANRDAIRRYNATYHEANREALVEQMAVYRAANRDAILAKQADWRDSHREHNRLYKAAHREQCSHRESTRRALTRGANGSHTLQEWRDKCALLGNVCVYCGEAKPLTRDHKVPLARGGSHDIENIVPACQGCNSSKGMRTAKEYLQN